MNAFLALSPLLGVTFEPPSTRDFVWGCLTPSAKIGPLTLCYNWIFLLLTIAFVATIALFYFGLRRPKLVPGRFQNVVEAGVEFVRNQIAVQMIGPEGVRFLPLLTTLFFFIFFGNVLEVIPGVNFPLNSRLAFPMFMAVVSWVVYNGVGIARHGLLGYLRLVSIPSGAPAWILPFLAPIEFFSTVIVRPITLTIRLTANMIAGHFLLSVFFLGTIVLLTGAPYVGGVLPFALAILLVGFELFVSALQAFIFAVLTASYISGALAEAH